MKYLPFFGFVLIYGCCFALPQFPGISSMELLNAIENLDQRHYFSSEQVDVGANGGTAAGGATGCNYQDYSSNLLNGLLMLAFHKILIIQAMAKL
jgi:hypothetical protein